MTANLQTLSLQLVAAVTNGISTAQSLGAAGALNINGSLVTGGVAVFDVARRVGISSVGNDSGIAWTITGTDRYGRTQSEVLTGAAAGATVQSLQDYKTVTSIASSGATAGNVTAGTTTVASTVALVMDYFVNPAQYRVNVAQNGVANWTIEESITNVSPDFDFTKTPPNWFSEAAFNAINSSANGTLTGPLTLVRLTINSGTGLVVAEIATPFIAGGA